MDEGVGIREIRGSACSLIPSARRERVRSASVGVENEILCGALFMGHKEYGWDTRYEGGKEVEISLYPSLDWVRKCLKMYGDREELLQPETEVSNSLNTYCEPNAC